MFEGFGRAVYDVGASGNGRKIKYVADLLVGTDNVASAEARSLGTGGALPPKADFDLIKARTSNAHF